MFFDRAPVAIERGDKLAIGGLRPIFLFPGRTGGVLLHIGGIILECAEEVAPVFADGSRIVLIAGVEFLDIGGVATIQERGERHLVVGLILPCHVDFRNPRSGSLHGRVANSE